MPCSATRWQCSVQDATTQVKLVEGLIAQKPAPMSAQQPASLDMGPCLQPGYADGISTQDLNSATVPSISKLGRAHRCLGLLPALRSRLGLCSRRPLASHRRRGTVAVPAAPVAAAARAASAASATETSAPIAVSAAAPIAALTAAAAGCRAVSGPVTRLPAPAMGRTVFTRPFIRIRCSTPYPTHTPQCCRSVSTSPASIDLKCDHMPCMQCADAHPLAVCQCSTVNQADANSSSPKPASLEAAAAAAAAAAAVCAAVLPAAAGRLRP